MQVMEIEDDYGLTVCKRQQLVVEKGQGTVIWDDQGRSLLDFTSGWGVTCLGHAHPVILNAMAEQAAKIIQNPNSGFTYSPARASLLLELGKVLPIGLDRVYFANSGAEANDAALKLARKITGRQTVLAVQGSFHGRTLATLSVSGGMDNGARFLPQVPGNRFVGLNDMNALAANINNDVAAVIVEPVQGEGGVRHWSADSLRQLRQLCQQHGALLVIDEVQTGFCRTGTFFASEPAGVVGDIMTMGKGIAGGLPFAALAMTERLASAVRPGDHGGTYCGNPLACAVSAAVIRYLREHEVAAQVSDMGQTALTDLLLLQREFPHLIKEVRGVGLMLAIELFSDDWVWPLTDLCLACGLIVTPTRNAVVRLLPNLLMTTAEWQQGLGLLRRALALLSHDIDETYNTAPHHIREVVGTVALS
jgi:acetylornithine/N-succinyldiaminopimelate aminotransferase